MLQADLVPIRDEIVAEQAPGTAQSVRMHDGSWVTFRSVAEYYDATNRDLAYNYIPLAALCNGAHRRHVHRQADGRRAGRVRAVRQTTCAQTARAPLVRRAFKEYATGRFTKQQLLQQATTWGLRNRRGQPLSSQAAGMLLRNQLYAGIADVPDYGVRGGRGDFEPLITEDTSYRVQAVLSGRIPRTAPQVIGHPDFPLLGFVRCESCGRGLTGSWSKGRSSYYAPKWRLPKVRPEPDLR